MWNCEQCDCENRNENDACVNCGQPEAFKFACHKCGGHIETDSQQSGSIVDCPHCNLPIEIPNRQKRLVQPRASTETSVEMASKTSQQEQMPGCAAMIGGHVAILVFGIVGIFVASFIKVSFEYIRDGKLFSKKTPPAARVRSNNIENSQTEKEYIDPNGRFACTVPAGWLTRNYHETQRSKVQFYTDDAQIIVITSFAIGQGGRSRG